MAEPETLPAPTEIPAPTTPNWTLARELYLQEVPLKEISKRVGASVHAIRCRAWRNNWRSSNEPATVEEQFQPRSMQDLVKEWIWNMALSLLASSRYWSSQELRPETTKDARDLEAARQAHIASGRALFNLDKPDSDPNRVGWSKPGADAKVIDVNPVLPPAPVPPKAPKK